MGPSKRIAGQRLLISLFCFVLFNFLLSLAGKDRMKKRRISDSIWSPSGDGAVHAQEILGRQPTT